MKTERDLPAWLWLYLPLAIVLLQFPALAIDRDFYDARIRTENGLIESLTVPILLGATVTARLGDAAVV